MYTKKCNVCDAMLGIGVITKKDREQNPSKVFTSTCPKCGAKYDITNGVPVLITNKKG